MAVLHSMQNKWTPVSSHKHARPDCLYHKFSKLAKKKLRIFNQNVILTTGDLARKYQVAYDLGTDQDMESSARGSWKIVAANRYEFN